MSPPRSSPRLAHLALALGFVALLVAAGCARTVHPIKGRLLIAAIEIEGTDELDEDDLRDGLALARLQASDQDFDPYLVAVDAARLRAVYLRHGHFAVDVRSSYEERGGLVTIRFVVAEGPRAKLARVELAGLPDDPRIDRKKLRGVLEIEDGAPFDYALYEEAKPKLVAALESFGYAHATLDAKLAADRARHEAIVRLEFTPGPLAAFGPITFEGVDGPLRDAAMARFMIETGDRYSSTELGDTQDALYDMARFSSVKVEPDRSAGGPVVPIKITVKEAPRHELRAGGGVGVDPLSREIRGKASLRVAGFPSTLTTSFVELRPAIVFLRDEDEPQPRVEAIASLQRQDLFRTFLTGEAEVGYEYRAFEAYTAYGPSTRLGLRSPIYRRIVEVAAGWQLRSLQFSRVDEAIDGTPLEAELGLDRTNRVGFFEQAMFVDLRDNPVQPRLGLYGEVRVEEGSEAAGGRFEYLRVAPELRGYVPLFGAVLAARGRIGTLRGDLPVTQRYFAGGASSQRGFAERRLAPTASRTIVDDDGDERTYTAPYGGGALVESGVELRVPLGDIKGLAIGGVGFLDGADVTERFSGLDFARQHWAAGGGLRLATPIGPVRFDLGFRLNRRSELLPDDTFAFHLSLGEAF